eukprot:TRINITY_DN4532_c0_g1_i1.p1 TRINITY_DN4532_c0_g1~~TRINITY_DN4532_c0_g1_i1.p1  ORF type:complete len:875 (+),score=255.10 TRINITY_DN4532_c0_g1_i1:97-2721(+)
MDAELRNVDLDVEPPSPAGFPSLKSPASEVRPHQFTGDRGRSNKLWELMATYLPDDVESTQRQIVNHVEYTLCRTRYNFDNHAAYQATAFSVRDRLIELWNDTHQYITATQQKRVYYLSLEFLIGRSLQNAIMNLGLQDCYTQSLKELGYQLEDLFDEETDAALGNGGLGRLAACFLDSMATLNLPGWGYGIRYQYGMFQQRIADGCQVEHPDYWLTFGNPWEIARLDVQYPVMFYGKVVQVEREDGSVHHKWEGGEIVRAVAYDNPIPGYNTKHTCNIRLWASHPPREFDLSAFNQGDYLRAIESKQQSENITRVLYPSDNTLSGKELRLKQQYFFVSATLRDIMRRYKKIGLPLVKMAEYVAIQLNDTHPSISIAEMMRILVDEEGMQWQAAWAVTQGCHAFTNHTVLPEALERWSVPLMSSLLPRHMQIIFEINYYFLEEVARTWPNNVERITGLSLIEECEPKMIRMAHLAIVGSHAVNGVAELHTELVKQKVFRHFFDLWPNKFQNKTNGVTPRRWVQQANPGQSAVMTRWLETDAWVTKLELLQGLQQHASNPQLQQEWAAVKRANKERLAAYIRRELSLEVSPDAMFDVQCKRLHEYKRQLLNILYVIHRYTLIKQALPAQRSAFVKRVVIFAGKAAPGYDMAKRVIKLIHAVADVVNRDLSINDLLKVVFIPNYNVSLAELIVPANDLSQHISTAGTEASGTSNMKFVMNGGLILGTLDGANIEIREETGAENMFIFGAKVNEVADLRRAMRDGKLPIDSRFHAVLERVERGDFGNVDMLRPLVQSLRNGNDHYLLGADFASYVDAQNYVDQTFSNQREWIKRTILSTSRMAKFSSDRTIQEYATQIWNIKPVERPDTQKKFISRQ